MGIDVGIAVAIERDADALPTSIATPIPTAIRTKNNR